MGFITVEWIVRKFRSKCPVCQSLLCQLQLIVFQMSSSPSIGNVSESCSIHAVQLARQPYEGWASEGCCLVPSCRSDRLRRLDSICETTDLQDGGEESAEANQRSLPSTPENHRGNHHIEAQHFWYPRLGLQQHSFCQGQMGFPLHRKQRMLQELKWPHL